MNNTLFRGSTRQRQGGFTLVEITIAFLIFTLMVLGCAAAFPTALRAQHTGNNYAQAALVAQHKIDQCREQGYTAVFPGSGTVSARMAGVGMVDSGSGQPNPAGYPAGSVAYTFTGADHLGGSQFPQGTVGTLVVGPANTGTAAGHWTPIGQVVQVTVVIAWPAGNEAAGRLTTHTLIVNA